MCMLIIAVKPERSQEHTTPNGREINLAPSLLPVSATAPVSPATEPPVINTC